MFPFEGFGVSSKERILRPSPESFIQALSVLPPPYTPRRIWKLFCRIQLFLEEVLSPPTTLTREDPRRFPLLGLAGHSRESPFLARKSIKG